MFFFLLDEFWARQKVGKQSQMSATLAANLIPSGWFWRGRRDRRGAREEKEEGLLRTVDEVFKSVQQFSVWGSIRRSAGGGGSMGYLLFRRPQISFLFCIGFWIRACVIRGL